MTASSFANIARSASARSERRRFTTAAAASSAAITTQNAVRPLSHSTAMLTA